MKRETDDRVSNEKTQTIIYETKTKYIHTEIKNEQHESH